MTKTEFRDELLDMVDYQNKKFGDYKNTDVNQTGEILKDYFKFDNYEIVENPTIEDTKKIISEGNIIITPLYGVGLNPHFTGRGPEYHFLVIKGYTQTDFITHEVGSNYGEDYQYNQKDLFDRIHDYDKTGVKNGKKRYIVLKK